MDQQKIQTWIKLIIVSLTLSFCFLFADFPAAFLVGPMLSAIIFSIRGLNLTVAKPLMLCAQATIGVLIASSLNTDTLVLISNNGILIIMVVSTTVLFSAFTGWIIARTGKLPGATAAWGSAPGAATGMIVLSEENGADPRLVAIMQFLRVTMVVLIATFVSRFFFETKASGFGIALTFELFSGDFVHVLFTCATIIAGAIVARFLPLPSGGVFVPLLLGFAVQSLGAFQISLPPALLYAAFAVIGLWVGLKFERAILLHAIRALPIMLIGCISLIALCGVSALLLVWIVDVDPLTAYLATTPGALEAVTILAMSSNSDISYILSLQTVRLLIVISTGPLLAKMICRLL